MKQLSSTSSKIFYCQISLQLKYIVLLIIWHHLFLEFWLVSTWFFVHWRHQRDVACLENVHQLSVRWDKKLSSRLSHTQPLWSKYIIDHNSSRIITWNKQQYFKEYVLIFSLYLTFFSLSLYVFNISSKILIHKEISRL